MILTPVYYITPLSSSTFFFKFVSVQHLTRCQLAGGWDYSTLVEGRGERPSHWLGGSGHGVKYQFTHRDRHSIFSRQRSWTSGIYVPLADDLTLFLLCRFFN